MAKKNLKKLSWECEHGCEVMNAPCKHLERKLDNPNKGYLSHRFMKENLDSVLTEIQNDKLDDNALAGSLTSYGLHEHEIELILDRYVANLSFQEIADKQGYLNRKEVWRLLQDITTRLKKSPEFKKWLTSLTKET